MIDRRSVIKGLLGVILTGLFAATYGFIIEPALRLRVKRWRIRRSGWTAPRLRIAIISDLHAGGPIVPLPRVQQVVRRTNALKPDVIVLLGDFAASHRFVRAKVPFEQVADAFTQLEAKGGVHAVLGNHDWWDDLAAQRRGSGPNIYAQALEARGIPVLSNQAVWLAEAGIWLAGLEDQLAQRRAGRGFVGLDDLDKTLGQVPDDGKPCVLLAHEPDVFPKVPSRVDLTLSGHTHGGQIRLFGWSPRVPSKYGNRFAYGHVHEKGRDLVVSGGIGCSILPVRFGVVPEITLVEVSA